MLARLVEEFHQTHERRYHTAERDNDLEITNWRVRATGLVRKVSFPERPPGSEDTSAARKGKRKAYFEDLGGSVETPVYEGARLSPGYRIEGPAILEDYASTLVIPPRARITVTRWGDYFLELA